MRLATLTKTQQSSPSAQAEQKQPGLSQLLVPSLDAVTRNDSGLQHQRARLGCSLRPCSDTG